MQLSTVPIRCWSMAEPRYSAIHMTLIDAMIFATRVGFTIGEMYLKDDARDLELMTGAIAWDHRMEELHGRKN